MKRLSPEEKGPFCNLHKANMWAGLFLDKIITLVLFGDSSSNTFSTVLCQEERLGGELLD
jgi:hypothetical protein